MKRFGSRVEGVTTFRDKLSPTILPVEWHAYRELTSIVTKVGLRVRVCMSSSALTSWKDQQGISWLSLAGIGLCTGMAVFCSVEECCASGIFEVYHRILVEPGWDHQLWM